MGSELYRDVRHCSDAAQLPGIRIFRFHASLYFGNADFFQVMIFFFRLSHPFSCAQSNLLNMVRAPVLDESDGPETGAPEPLHAVIVDARYEARYDNLDIVAI